MKKRIVFDASKCVACHACTIACIDQNDTAVENGEQAMRNAYNLEMKDDSGQTRFVFFSTACMHCQDAPCIMACPVGCLYKSNETGMTVYDNTNCIGCRSCGMACPFGAPRYRPSDGKMVKCDGCHIRVEYGMEPACVRVCAFGALRLVTEEEYQEMIYGKAKNSMLQAMGVVGGA